MFHSSIRDRRLALLLVGVAVGLAVVRLALLQGLVAPLHVEGGSMAEALPGEHIEVVCAHCGRNWQADLVQAQQTTQLRCPECGQQIDDESQSTARPATSVVLDRAAYYFANPQRFDVVAFQMTDRAGELGVKRVVALPGERWSIERGELIVNARLVRKSFRQFQKLASVVSDPNMAILSPWKPERPDSRWRSDQDMWSWNSTPDSKDAVDWLVFHSTATHPAASSQPAPVSDNDPYNPAIARELNSVVDLVVECKLSAHDTTLHLRIHDGHEWLETRWDGTTATVLRQDREIERCRLAPGLTVRQVAWGLCDRQLFLVVEGNTILHLQLEERPKRFSPEPTPLMIGASGTGECRLKDLRVLRDVYYLDPNGRGGTWHAPPLAADEYGLLGDNPPLSIDSRQAEHGVPRRQMLGRVLPHE